MRVADALSGLGITGFGGLLGWRAFRHTLILVRRQQQ